MTLPAAAAFLGLPITQDVTLEDNDFTNEGYNNEPLENVIIHEKWPMALICFISMQLFDDKESHFLSLILHSLLKRELAFLPSLLLQVSYTYVQF